MSAYMVDLDHIAFLVEAGTAVNLGAEHFTLSWVWNIDHEADTYERATLRAGDLDEQQRVGQMLWDENAKSVQHRYPGDRDLPGPCDCDYQYPRDTTLRPHFYTFDPVQVLKACDCYEYQACEHNEWPTSEAEAYIAALRHYAWTALPGYDEAEWGAPKSRGELKVAAV